MSTPDPRWIWGGLLAAGAAYEAYGIHGDVEGDTLSEVTRELFHTSHPVGKAIFLTAYLTFSAWFVPHIIIKASGAAMRVAERHAAELEDYYGF